MMMTWQSLQTSSEGGRRGCSPRAAHAGAAGAPGAAAVRPPASAASQPSAATAAAPRGGCRNARFQRWRQHCCSAGARRQLALRPAAAPGASGAGRQPQQQETLADVMGNIFKQLAEIGQPAGAVKGSGAHLHVDSLAFQPPGGWGGWVGYARAGRAHLLPAVRAMAP